MSSNIKVNRICEYCKKNFIAKTTRTRYCSHLCNSRDYKLRLKNIKINVSNIDTKKTIEKPYKDISVKEFLTVREVAILINCSKKNVYKLINSGKLKATNILIKKTIVKRKEIDKLFN